MKRIIIILTILVTLSMACSLSGLTSSGDDTATQNEPPPQGENRCGDGVCDGPENAKSCPGDCTADSPGDNAPGAGAEADTHWVVNPSSGARLFVQILKPEGWNSEALPTLVLVPGGTGDSSHFTDDPRRVQGLLDAGFALVVFDPDGRGNSEGEENQNGYAHQDGLAAIIEYAAALPEVDAEHIGLVSYSYGVTMATGVLARHPGLPIRFLIDWEGPANRNDTGGCDEDKTGHLTGHPCDDEDFWGEREASNFALYLQVPYQRLQSESDHAQPDNDHALLMIANATAEEYGGHGQASWTRLNDLTPNTVYNQDVLPLMLSNEAARKLGTLIAAYAEELFALTGE